METYNELIVVCPEEGVFVELRTAVLLLAVVDVLREVVVLCVVDVKPKDIALVLETVGDVVENIILLVDKITELGRLELPEIRSVLVETAEDVKEELLLVAALELDSVLLELLDTGLELGP